MTLRVFIPCDAGALAVGAEEVAVAVAAAAKGRRLDIEIVRTGSRGLYWLEPILEVETPTGRIAFGPVAQHDVDGLLEAIATDTTHPLRL
jgi:formate dehydrogenase iron-sulfur subunit